MVFPLANKQILKIEKRIIVSNIILRLRVPIFLRSVFAHSRLDSKVSQIMGDRFSSVVDEVWRLMRYTARPLSWHFIRVRVQMPTLIFYNLSMTVRQDVGIVSAEGILLRFRSAMASYMGGFDDDKGYISQLA